MTSSDTVERIRGVPLPWYSTRAGEDDLDDRRSGLHNGRSTAFEAAIWFAPRGSGVNAHDAVTALVARWYDTGDRSAGSELVGLLHRQAHPGLSFVRVLGQQRVEELAQDALVKLLDRERRALDGARDPFALVRAVARNLALSELRRLRRRERLALVRSDDLGGDEVEGAAERCGDSERPCRRPSPSRSNPGSRCCSPTRPTRSRPRTGPT